MSENKKNIEEEVKKAAKKVKETAKDIAKDIDENTKEFQEDAKGTAEEFKKGAKEAYEQLTADSGSKRVLVGVLAILFGAIGLHKFILGYNKEGLIMLVISALTFGFGALLMGLIGIVEGVIYLTKSDDEFYQTYQVNTKHWF